MRETAQERINNASNLLDVLLVLEDKILKDTHVSTLAYINKEVTAFDENKGYGIYEEKFECKNRFYHFGIDNFNACEHGFCRRCSHRTGNDYRRSSGR